MQQFPPIVFGTSCLGNIYEATSYENKLAIVKACVEHAPEGIAMFDTAGKYGAGLALEMLGKSLNELNVPKEKVIISNKLGWYRVPLTGPEPTFEKDIWKNLEYDAVQKISYDGILECFEQGNELLGNYPSQSASVHDPDEYLAAATDKQDEAKRYSDIIEAYRALHELKRNGKIQSIGVGAKNWRSIQRIAHDVKLDWVMLANSLTIHTHPKALLEFVAELHQQQVAIINSAVFNGGFLVGKDYYNYNYVDASTPQGQQLFTWRDQFFATCKEYDVLPAEACFNYGFNIPGVVSVALSTTVPSKVKTNIDMATKKIPAAFWEAMKQKGLLDEMS